LRIDCISCQRSALIVGEAPGVPLGSFAELSRQKIVFDLQLADLPVQNIDLRLVGGALRHAAALEMLDAPPADT
jgi:hypothetical protein